MRIRNLTNGFSGLIGRVIAVLALAVPATPLVAQDAPTEIRINTPAESTGQPAPEAIGPRELENFSLDGQVTRQADPPATTAPAQPTTTVATGEVSAQPVNATPTTRTAATRPADNAPRSADAAQSTSASAILSRRPTLPEAGSTASPTVAALPGLDTTAPLADQSSGFSPLPWIAALLLLGAGAVVYFGRQGRDSRYAGAASNWENQSVARPLPRAATPRPVTPPAKFVPTQPTAPPPRKPPTTLIPKPAGTGGPTGAGIVSTSLRPWVEIELTPMQAAVTDEQAAITFEVTLFNSGSAPARDIAIEPRLLNAGASQDKALSDFFLAPGDVRDTIPIIAPFARIQLKSAVRLNRDAILEYEVEGRKMFIPMVAVNARYRWSSGEGHSAAAFLIGRGGEAEEKGKLGPLRTDRGARVWKDLAMRRYEKGLRR